MSDEVILPSGLPKPDMKGLGHYNRRWHPAAMCIANGMTTAATAKHCNISHGTLQHWRRHPQFKAYVNRLHDDAIAAAVGIMAGAITSAATVVIELLKSDNERVRLEASDRVQGWLKVFRNDALVIEKLEELKKQMTAAIPANAVPNNE